MVVAHATIAGPTHVPRRLLDRLLVDAAQGVAVPPAAAVAAAQRGAQL